MQRTLFCKFTGFADKAEIETFAARSTTLPGTTTVPELITTLKAEDPVKAEWLIAVILIVTALLVSILNDSKNYFCEIKHYLT